METETPEDFFIVECNQCKQQYINHVGSTPCCGSLAYLVENGNITDKVKLFACVLGSAIKPTTITLKTKE